MAVMRETVTSAEIEAFTASPGGCQKLCAFVRERLKERGYDRVAVGTEW